MKGTLYKEDFVWLIEYQKQINNKFVKRNVELHPDDIESIEPDERIPNIPNHKAVEFDIVIITGDYKRPVVVGKIIQPELPVILVTKENEDDE